MAEPRSDTFACSSSASLLCSGRCWVCTLASTGRSLRSIYMTSWAGKAGRAPAPTHMVGPGALELDCICSSVRAANAVCEFEHSAVLMHH